ncbi:hypothetical protein DVDV_3557 [Desulfovibrio sp. DV]|nr:hypothetical protein DVDV_3557 [Desulfovibrio sp. DV]
MSTPPAVGKGGFRHCHAGTSPPAAGRLQRGKPWPAAALIRGCGRLRGKPGRHSRPEAPGSQDQGRGCF